MNLNQYLQSAAQPGLAVEKIINIYTILPNTLEQCEMANYIDEKTAIINKSISKIQKEIDLITEYRIRLISDVVTGKVDVCNIIVDEMVSEDSGMEIEDEEVIDTEDAFDIEETSES